MGWVSRSVNTRPQIAPPPACLERERRRSQVGGTLIVDDIIDIPTHEMRIRNPDGYRPKECPSCHHRILHLHDYRERVLRGDPERTHIRIARYKCVACKAVWRMLPMFVARWLWRSWRVVEAETMSRARSILRPSIPLRTAQRWLARLETSAQRLIFMIIESTFPWTKSFVNELRGEQSRSAFIQAYAIAAGSVPGARFSHPAAVVHRLGSETRLL